MSKTDAMRAMKQARAEAAAASRPATPRPPAARPAAVRPTPGATRPDPGPSQGASLADLAPEALCGHQAIGGKRCTRPQGHAEKNHRYAA